MEATAKKKKDAKNLAFKMMAVKLGEILRLLKPQPGISAAFFGIGNDCWFYPRIEVLTKLWSPKSMIIVLTKVNDNLVIFRHCADSAE